MDDKTIRFIDTSYKELFSIPDGGYVQVDYPSGESKIRQCHFEDATHTKVGNRFYHIHELAMALERAGGIAAPIEPEIVGNYTITDKVKVGDMSFALAHNPKAPATGVTWQQAEGRTGWDLGHYYADFKDAETDFMLRSDAERTGKAYLPYAPPEKNRDDAR